MNGLRIWSWARVIGLLVSAGCASEAAVTQVSAQAGGVQVERGDPPPPGAELVGPITATDGYGCGFGGERGTQEGATALLRAAAARRGIGYVQVTQVTKPYSGHDCYHQAFTLSGLGYRLANAPRAENRAPPAGAAASGTPPAAYTAGPPGDACAPPCSPGYACHASVCEPECNPACAAGRVCRADRVCVP